MQNANNLNVLMKFFRKEEYLNDFLNGNLYISHLGRFQDLEEKQLTGTQADALESLIAQFQPKYSQLTFSVPNLGISHTIPVESYAAPSTLSSPHLLNLKCLCFYAPVIDLTDLDTVKKQLFIPKKMEEDFGGFLVVFHNPSKFFKRIADAIKSKGYSYTAKKVKYFSADDHFHSVGSDMGFDKSDTFAFQKEFRILIETPEHEATPLRLNIGDIRDFCLSLSVDQFNNNTDIDMYKP